VAVSNRKGESSYYWSFGYTDRNGILSGDRYKNYRTRLNLETTIAKFLTVGMNTNFSVRDEGYFTADAEDRWTLSPYASYNIGDTSMQERWWKYPMEDVSAAYDAYDNLYKDKMDMYYNLSSNMYAKVKLPLNIEYQFNFTPHLQFRNYYYHESSKHVEWASKGGYAQRSNYVTYDWQIDNVLRWKREMGFHNLEATLLYNAEKNQYWATTAEASLFSPNDVLGYHRMQAGTVPLTSSDDQYESGDALMARLFYSFKNRYMVTASVRRDGYSAFGDNYKRATFPAVALGWVFTEEGFMKDASSNWFNYGKLRFSWGVNGNRSIGKYSAISDMTSSAHPYIDGNGSAYITSQMYVNRMANADLRWERQQSYNFGLDFAMFDNILSGSIEGYTGQTYDLLVSRKLPDITGFSSVYANLGQLNNSGLEITLNAQILKKENVNWKATLTYSMNRRKLVSLYGDMEDIYNEEGEVIGQKESDDLTNGWFIGKDPNVIWAYERIGVWQLGEEEEAKVYGLLPGDFKYKDQNGDGVMTNDDKVFQGYTTPRSRWTFNTDINFCKNWTASASFYANFGQKGTFNIAANRPGFLDRTSNYDLPRWTEFNPINDYGRLESQNIGNYYIAKSFIRFDNFSIAYSLPKTVAEKLHMQNMRISANIRNVFCWSPTFNYWYDPEQGNYFPRTFTLGVHFAL